MSKLTAKQCPLGQTQQRLLYSSLKRLLGPGLLSEPAPDKKALKKELLRSALNLIVLE